MDAQEARGGQTSRPDEPEEPEMFEKTKRNKTRNNNKNKQRKIHGFLKAFNDFHQKPLNSFRNPTISNENLRIPSGIPLF